jgi:hypothetical protein
MGTDMTEIPERLADYRRDPHYERRVVVFYDVLGWRNHIAATGDNPKRIGDLRRLILQHVRTLGLRTHMNIRVSTFSDNVVITQSLGPDTPWLIAHRGINRVVSAAWMRADTHDGPEQIAPLRDLIH